MCLSHTIGPFLPQSVCFFSLKKQSAENLFISFPFGTTTLSSFFLSLQFSSNLSTPNTFFIVVVVYFIDRLGFLVPVFLFASSFFFFLLFCLVFLFSSPACLVVCFQWRRRISTALRIPSSVSIPKILFTQSFLHLSPLFYLFSRAHFFFTNSLMIIFFIKFAYQNSIKLMFFILVICSPGKRGIAGATGAQQLYGGKAPASSRGSNGTVGDNEDFCSDASLDRKSVV